MRHALTIKAVDDPSPLGGWREFTITCFRVTDDCRAWEQCQVPGCRSVDAERDVNAFLHGQRHQPTASGWSVATDACYLTDADELPDVAEETADREQLEQGTYLVDHFFSDGRLESLTVIGTDST